MNFFRDILLLIECTFAFVFFLTYLIGLFDSRIPYEHLMLTLNAALLLTIIIKIDLKN